MAGKVLNTIGKLGIGLAITGGIVSNALYNVEGGHRAVIFDRFSGVSPNVSGEGTHFLIPWVQRPIIFDVRSRPRTVPVITGSKDLQNVNITLRILFRPLASELPKIYMSLGEDFDERVLPSITTEVLKAVVVSHSVQEALVSRASSFGLILDDISLTHLTFGKEFTEAVELKQVAQQEAERARFLVERAEQQKQAAIITAEGDAKGADLLSRAFKKAGDGLIELRKLEAGEEIAQNLAGSRNVAYLPDGQGVLMNLPAP